MQEYEDSYGNQASLINQDGFIEISTTYNGYEKKDWFGVYDQEHIREQVLGFQESDKSMELWTNSGPKEEVPFGRELWAFLNWSDLWRQTFL